SDPEPAHEARSDAPPESWAVALPVPDLAPLAASALPAHAEPAPAPAPVQSAVEAAVPAPAPSVEAQPEEDRAAPVAAAQNGVGPPEPQTIVVEGAAPVPPVVTTIVVAPFVVPVVVGRGSRAPRMTVPQRLPGPTAPPRAVGGGRTFVPARPRAH